MNAPEIPNLLETMRASRTSQSPRRGGRRGRGGRGSQSGPGGLSDASGSVSTFIDASEAEQDKIVQQTDNDAAGSRLSAADIGYLDDPFAHIFAARPARRLPIINRGTYVRTSGVDALLEEFLSPSRSYSYSPFSSHSPTPSVQPTTRKQIISLGAGTDTRYFRFLQRDPSLATRLVYHELDFPVTTTKKIAQLQSNKLHNILRIPPASIVVSEDEASLASPTYHIHGVDLRLLSSSPSAPSISTTPWVFSIDPALDTLILSECCLTYMPLPVSSSLLTHLLQKIFIPSTSVHVVLYEPVNPYDAFGRTMMQNLASRKILMPGMEALPSIAAHKGHLKELGFKTGQEAWEVHKWWDDKVSPAEKERLRRLEGLDEEEEWVLLSSHYAFIHAWR